MFAHISFFISSEIKLIKSQKKISPSKHKTVRATRRDNVKENKGLSWRTVARIVLKNVEQPNGQWEGIKQLKGCRHRQSSSLNYIVKVMWMTYTYAHVHCLHTYVYAHTLTHIQYIGIMTVWLTRAWLNQFSTKTHWQIQHLNAKITQTYT